MGFPAVGQTSTLSAPASFNLSATKFAVFTMSSLYLESALMDGKRNNANNSSKNLSLLDWTYSFIVCIMLCFCKVTNYKFDFFCLKKLEKINFKMLKNAKDFEKK